jgi:hypothetical protein
LPGKKKRELMIVSDGMDATVITGSRNVVDGSTTFNSATLGEDASFWSSFLFLSLLSVFPRFTLISPSVT